MLVQQAQVELHQVPADDRIRVMPGHPLVQALQQGCAILAIMQFEIHRRRIAVCRAKHVDLALAAAFQGDAVQLAALAGLDVQGHQAKRRAVTLQGFELGVVVHALCVRLTGELHRSSDEALHQVALRRADVSFENVYAGAAQTLLQLHQLTVLAGVEAEHRTQLEVFQAQRLELHCGLVGQQQTGLRSLRQGMNATDS